ncbi:hypothetical protein AZE42_12953 [Rhizopogon vesiculosus]|uniref:Uncharacterized protein n=1 Tax=Rhizopogon vesiculosus TaxID=180088 RepID=A0A1J8QSA8_9AGAM|nr:hypothetical protein AZE42_12953 [Rhizopogon vesiculosus]
MVKILLITDTVGNVLRTLIDSVAFGKNLPDSIVLPAAATPEVNSPQAHSDLPPSSPLHWSPSPPPQTHHKVPRQVSKPLRSRVPTSQPPRPCAPTEIHPRQPTESVVPRSSHPTSCHEPARSLATQRDTRRHEYRKVVANPPLRKRKRDGAGEGEDTRNIRHMQGSNTQYNPGDHHHVQHNPMHLPRHQCSPSPSTHQYRYHRSRSPIRPQFPYTQESAAVAGPS